MLIIDNSNLKKMTSQCTNLMTIETMLIERKQKQNIRNNLFMKKSTSGVQLFIHDIIFFSLAYGVELRKNNHEKQLACRGTIIIMTTLFFDVETNFSPRRQHASQGNIYLYKTKVNCKLQIANCSGN